MSRQTTLLRRLLQSSPELCRLLLQQPSSFSEVNEDGENTILAACRSECPSALVKALLLAGINPYQTSKNGLCAAGAIFIPNMDADWASIQPKGDWSQTLVRTEKLNGEYQPALSETLPGAFGIHRAAALGLADEVKRLCEAGVSPNCRDAWGFTPIVHAMVHGRREALHALIELGADAQARQGSRRLSTAAVVLPAIDQLDPDFQALLKEALKLDAGETLDSYKSLVTIHQAAAADDVDTVRTLFELGVSTKCRSLSGTTPIIAAFRAGASAANALLRECEAEEFRRPGESVLPMRPLVELAQHQERPKTASSPASPKVNDPAPEAERTTPSYQAAFEALKLDDLAALHKELDLGLDPNSTSPDGTPLICEAGLRRRAQMVTELLKRGADPTRTRADGLNALECSWKIPGNHAVSTILEKALAGALKKAGVIRAEDEDEAGQADAGAVDAGDEEDAPEETLTEAAFRAVREEDLNALEACLDEGLDPNCRDEQGTPILCRAAAMGRCPVVQLLLHRGASVYAKDRNGDNALNAAARMSGNMLMLCILKSAAAAAGPEADEEAGVVHEPDAPKDALAESAFRAVREDDLSALEACLNQGLDANCRDVHGTPILCFAAALGRSPLAQLLIQRGANVYETDRSGDNALDAAARMSGSTLILSILNAAAARQTPPSPAPEPAPAPESEPEAKEAPDSEPDVEKAAERKAPAPAYSAPGPAAAFAPDDAFKAVWNDDISLLKVMLESGLDPDCRSPRTGVPLLAQAAYWSRENAVRLLLEWNADPEATTPKGAAVLKCARKPSIRAIIQEAVAARRRTQSPASPDASSFESAFLAISRNDFKDFIAELDRGLDPNCRNRDGMPLLCEAASWPRFDFVQALLMRGAKVAQKNALGFNALDCAMMSRSYKSVPLLQEFLEDELKAEEASAGVGVAAGDKTALAEAAFLAVRTNSMEDLRGALDRGLDPNCMSAAGMTLLAEAAAWDRCDMAKELLDRGADLNAHGLNDADALTIALLIRPLGKAAAFLKRGPAGPAYDAKSSEALAIAAAARCDYDALKHLLQMGVDPNCRSDDGHPLLAHAVDTRRATVVQIVLDAGADPLLKLPDGRTVYRYARSIQSSRATLTLIKDKIDSLTKPAPLDPLNDENASSPSEAFRNIWFGQPEKLRAALENGVDPNSKTNAGTSLLVEAILWRSSACVKILLDYGADPNEIQADGKTVLDLARSKSSTDRIITFIEEAQRIRGNSPSAAKESALTKEAFEAIVQKDCFEVFKRLLRKGLDPDARSAAGGVPILAEAASWGRLEVVKILIAAGADPAAVDDKGVSVLDRARSVPNNYKVIGIISRTIDKLGRKKQSSSPADAPEGEKPLRRTLTVRADAKIKIQEAVEAIRSYDRNALIQLVPSQVDPNALTADSVPLLTAALAQRWMTTVYDLLAAGADPDAAGASGKSSFDYAREAGGELAELFVKAIQNIIQSKTRAGQPLGPLIKYVAEDPAEEDDDGDDVWTPPKLGPKAPLAGKPRTAPDAETPRPAPAPEGRLSGRNIPLWTEEDDEPEDEEAPLPSIRLADFQTSSIDSDRIRERLRRLPFEKSVLDAFLAVQHCRTEDELIENCGVNLHQSREELLARLDAFRALKIFADDCHDRTNDD